MHAQVNTYIPFIISINRCDGSCNSLEYLFGRMDVPNKIEGVKLKIFNLIKGIKNQRHFRNVFQVIIDVNLMVRNVT